MKKNQLELLDMGLSECILGPVGDPDRVHLYAAACIAKALQKDGYKIDGHLMRQIRRSAKGPDGKPVDFMKVVERDLKA